MNDLQGATTLAPTTLAPTTVTAPCSSGCSSEFQICMQDHSFKTCKSEIKKDDGHMRNAGCTPSCTFTQAMNDLQGRRLSASRWLAATKANLKVDFIVTVPSGTTGATSAAKLQVALKSPYANSAAEKLAW